MAGEEGLTDADQATELARRVEALNEVVHVLFGRDATPVDVQDLVAPEMTAEETHAVFDALEGHLKQPSKEQSGS